MDGDLVLHVTQEALKAALLLTAPVLIVTLLVGLATAMLQAVTSLRDMTLGMVLKLASVAVTLLVCGGWMMTHAVNFTNQIFNTMGTLAK